MTDSMHTHTHTHIPAERVILCRGAAQLPPTNSKTWKEVQGNLSQSEASRLSQERQYLEGTHLKSWKEAQKIICQTPRNSELSISGGKHLAHCWNNFTNVCYTENSCINPPIGHWLYNLDLAIPVLE